MPSPELGVTGSAMKFLTTGTQEIADRESRLRDTDRTSLLFKSWGTGRSQLPGIPQSRRVTLGATFTRSKIRLTFAVRIRASPRIVIFLTHKFKA